MNTRDLRNCLLRFALWCDDFENNRDMGEMNDFEIQKDGLIEELDILLKGERN